jgi:eukaryotic-like serine/threonine-protein kinase
VIGSQILTRRRRRSAVREYRRVGPYHLEKQIGEGGMGKVFKAQHDLLKRPTALKILKPELTSETAIRRFSREVQFACQLHHPNTVDIYDYGCTTDGQFYYAMEYLSGLSLQELVHKFGPLPYPRGLYLLRQLCGSLGEAHRAGFVHRDVKPRNIMVCNCGGEADFVKVVDFGLVKSSEPRAERGDTTVGEWAGTPRYIAPERLLQPRIVDPRSDIYSVGVTMYWTFTGTEAFAGDGLDALLTSIMSEPPRPIAARFAMPAVLQEILQKCLAKIPADRFQTIEDLEVALTAVPNPDPWTPEAARAWWKTHLPNLSETIPIPVIEPTPIPESHLSRKSKISD